jgi:RecG-like helicase
VTAWVTEERSSEAYKRLRKHLDDGRQAYVVCPLIEESETSVARAAEREAERLRKSELRGYRVGLLHGRLRTDERRDLMARFKAGELDVMVATTVIEARASCSARARRGYPSSASPSSEPTETSSSGHVRSPRSSSTTRGR